MKLTFVFSAIALAISLCAAPLHAADQKAAAAGKTCCEKAKADGKQCTHKCCVSAQRAGKTCEKCNPKADNAKKKQ